jgi:hypothetical protein
MMRTLIPKRENDKKDEKQITSITLVDTIL